MSGKAYTMKEMKTIVDYLVEHKSYGEIRAKKMWVDFANTKLTSRTWQSLKETFLKRILPDIHNPYYNLTIEQINSFRVGYDVADRNKNKLDIQTISDDSNSNGHDPKDFDQTSNGNSNEGETTPGEIIKSSKIPQRSRSSADTVILDNCYETAEDIQKDLESNGDQETDVKTVPKSKSLRDCITYSEPLTPMLQEVLDDFASEPEDSDREGQMEIVESVPDNDNSEDINQNPEPIKEVPVTKSIATDVAKNAKGLSAEVVEEVLAQELDGSSKGEKKSPVNKTPNVTNEMEVIPILNSDDETSSMQAENGTENTNDFDKSDTLETAKIHAAVKTEELVAMDSENIAVSLANDSHTKKQEKPDKLNNSNSTVDASLPNNQEALKNKHSKNIDDKTTDNLESVKVSNNTDNTQSPLKSTRKRSFSVDTRENIENKKKKLEITLKSCLKVNNTSTSDTHINNKIQINENVELIKAVEEQPEADKESHIIEKPQAQINSEINKPTTSVTNDVADANDTEMGSNKITIAELKNPCLENVNLFDEQFNKTKYNMSESSDTEQNKKETQDKDNKQEGPVPEAGNDVIMLKSHTESDTEEVPSPPKKKTRVGVISAKTERDKAIANMFGFTSGGVGAKRKRQLSHRRRTISHNNASQHNVAAASNSSEWTSESENETFVSPPRGRKNRVTKKFLKPKSAKILSLEEDGGLFVMYGKKIYPIVKDGKIVKNYVNYFPESESDEGESYWKLKYVEEKKKADELKKLLERAKEPRTRDTISPILQANPLRNTNPHTHASSEVPNEDGKTICLPVADNKKEEAKVNPPEKIKIKFAKNNEEVHLEGHWPQIHPVLEQVVHIFHKEVEPMVSEQKSKMMVEPPQHENSKEPSSGISTPIITPIDPDVHEKVNKIEKEIFKEIEERAREEENEPVGQETNITKRKAGRPRKSESQSPVKPAKTTDQTDSKESVENKSTSKQNTTEMDDKDVAPKRSTRAPRKVLNETINTNEPKTIRTRRSNQKLDSSINNEEEEVRYMFPPKTTRQSLRSPANKKTNQKPQKSSTKTSKIFSSPVNSLQNTMDSTQGYQDSDISPAKIEHRKKKKLDMSSLIMKTRNSLRRNTRSRSHPYVYCDAYDDSSNSAVEPSIKVIARENSSLNTEAYKSESYQLLMPQAKNSIRHLEPINETSPVGNETYFVKDTMSINEISVQINNFFSATNSGQITSDAGSSSNVSLPMSPELSVVENMSISKDMLNSFEDNPTLNEMQANDIEEQTTFRKHTLSDVDVSVPLMQQNCGLESCNTITVDISTDPKGLVTESLLSKISTFNINDQRSATDTLDKKLHDLLLESAKKMTAEQCENKESMMEVDVSNAQAEQVKNKSKSKKRCSTPRKRTVSQKSKAPKIDPVVEEEHIESYSHSGRKSCPPQFQSYVVEDNFVNEEINIANLTINNKKPKGRKNNKEIIRVKIQRPKAKKAQEKLRTKSAKNASRISVFTDSGINNTESEIFLPVDDSVDLIHNHSETCLLANECVGDSVEFIENSKSVITLGDSMQSGDNAWISRSQCNDENSTSPDLFCNNAQDVTFYNKTNAENIGSTSDTVYYSPLGTEVSQDSLITEDLSDDPPPAPQTKWYLLSEDETTNTNMIGKPSTMLNTGSFAGSNLKQLFPIACVIPDLSTITEMSRENDDSRKPTLDLEGLTGDDFNSRSIFDSNF